MTAPNRNTLWADILIDELVENGVTGVCIAPGSRSTPLTVAAAQHDSLEVYSHLDERSAGFFALGRSRRSGDPTALICTSGTACANLHPAVMEANEGRVPLVVLTADRPPELHGSGANQTTDQSTLYGSAVRYHRTLPEPEPEERKLRSLRVIAGRSVAEAMGTPPGPVHLNVPFRKPLEPTHVEGDVPSTFEKESPLAVTGRDGPFVERTTGRSTLSASDVSSLVKRVENADRGMIVCGPTNTPTPAREALADLAVATGFPVLADPLSGHRFGSHSDSIQVCGGYDSYLDGSPIPEPDIVLRFGSSPTSKVLRKYLAASNTKQILVDPAGEWREAEFTATDLVAADPTAVATAIAQESASSSDDQYRKKFQSLEQEYWELISAEAGSAWFEGAVLNTVARQLPDPSTCFVSNSMPVRDLDRFGKPRQANVTVLGNRGVSGIDGIISSGLGAGSTTEDPLVLVLGDIAFYHDMNGLLALSRCAVDATIVLINNDGGGIFHKLPIESFDPPFTEQFRTPHGLNFEPTGELYDLDFEHVDGREEFEERFDDAVETGGTQVLSVQLDSESSHRTRERIHERVCKGSVGIE